VSFPLEVSSRSQMIDTTHKWLGPRQWIGSPGKRLCD